MAKFLQIAKTVDYLQIFTVVLVLVGSSLTPEQSEPQLSA